MRDMSRREAMETMLLASAGFTLTRLRNAEAQTAAAPQAFAGQHQPRPLPFDPARLNGMSAKLITSHWENNHIPPDFVVDGAPQRVRAAHALISR